MTVSISARDLAQLAKTPDRELRIEPQDGVNVLQKNEGWFGGRLARSLKIATNSDGRATNQAKQDQYEDAANAVFNSLVKTYGHDIACKAFKAGIGHQTNGQWDHSWNHPITGRHVQKMLSTAQSELKADNSAYRQMAFQPFKGPAGETLTRGSSLMWFQQSATLKESPDAEFWQNAGLRHDLRRLEYGSQSGVPGFEQRGFVVRSPLPEVQTDYNYKRGWIRTISRISGSSTCAGPKRPRRAQLASASTGKTRKPCTATCLPSRATIVAPVTPAAPAAPPR